MRPGTTASKAVLERCPGTLSSFDAREAVHLRAQHSGALQEITNSYNTEAGFLHSYPALPDVAAASYPKNYPYLKVGE
jgi:hypothetical protein